MKKITYTEPKDYMPKEIREKYFGKKKTSTAKKTATKRTTKKK